MISLLENIQRLLDNSEITQTQALFLIYRFNEVDYTIDEEELYELVNLGFVSGNKISKKLLMASHGTVTKLTGTIVPIFKSDLSDKIPKKLCKLFCVVTDKGTLNVPGSTGDEAVQDTAKKYLQGEGLITYHYLIFLFMFPVAGKTNKRWEKHFTKTEYKGPRLRLRSKVHGRKFKKIARDKDMGVFLYATYLYITSCIQGDKSFITTPNKFLDEFDEWYHDAQEAVDRARDIDDLFKKTVNKSILTVM